MNDTERKLEKLKLMNTSELSLDEMSGELLLPISTIRRFLTDNGLIFKIRDDIESKYERLEKMLKLDIFTQRELSSITGLGQATVSRYIMGITKRYIPKYQQYIPLTTEGNIVIKLLASGETDIFKIAMIARVDVEHVTALKTIMARSPLFK